MDRKMTNYIIQYIGNIDLCDKDNYNIDVEVIFDNGDRYSATFFTINNIKSIMDRHANSGESLNGSYFWASDMIIIKEMTHDNINQIIIDCIKTKIFDRVFVKLHEI